MAQLLQRPQLRTLRPTDLMRVLFLFILLGISAVGFAQSDSTEYDTTVMSVDSLEYFEDSEEYDLDGPSVVVGSDDTTRLETRSVDQETLKRLKDDDDLSYEQPPTVVESLWDKFVQWLREFLDSFFDGAINTNWGQVFTWLGIISVFVLVIFALLKVDAFKLVYKGETAQVSNGIDENIHEMNFNQLIDEATRKKDFRLAVRLTFLYALKILADKNQISWEQGKTNHDYLNELKAEHLRSGFESLNYYFEYSWYGNFAITEELYNRVITIFSGWKSKAEV